MAGCSEKGSVEKSGRGGGKERAHLASLIGRRRLREKREVDGGRWVAEGKIKEKDKLFLPMEGGGNLKHPF